MHAIAVIALVSEWQLIPQSKVTLRVGVADLEDTLLKVRAVLPAAFAWASFGPAADPACCL